MASRANGPEIASGALGVVALVLGAAAVLGVVRPGGSGAAGNVPVTAVVGVVAGVIGLYVGKTRGPGRQLAVLGTGVALLGLLLFGGALALDLLLDASGA